MDDKRRQLEEMRKIVRDLRAISQRTNMQEVRLQEVEAQLLALEQEEKEAEKGAP